MIRISKWGGLIQTASPYAVPAGGAVAQVNCQCLTPGQLTVRGGMTQMGVTSEKYLELWAYASGSEQTDLILGFTDQGKIVEIKGLASPRTEVRALTGSNDGL
jgi:hypothetical protein